MEDKRWSDGQKNRRTSKVRVLFLTLHDIFIMNKMGFRMFHIKRDPLKKNKNLKNI